MPPSKRKTPKRKSPKRKTPKRKTPNKNTRSYRKQSKKNSKSKISNPDELVDIFFELTKTKYSYFKYMYEIDIKESKAYQKLIHEKIDRYRLNPKREFFKLKIELAMNEFLPIIEKINQE